MATTKQEVTLKFPSFYTMWTFIRSARLSFYELDYAACILHGECSEEDISLAVIRYGATVIPSQGARIRQSHQ